MRIGVTFNVRPTRSPGQGEPLGDERAGSANNLARDDFDEEFDAPETIEAMAAALTGLGHEVELLGYGEPLVRRLLAGPKPDLVWNIAEGHGSGRCREARVPALLEMLDIPYTCSDALTLATTLDKDCAKRLIAASGLATPNWALYTGDWSAVRREIEALNLPVFVKPAYEGSSKGILDSCLVSETSRLEAILTDLYETYQQGVLVEEFIDGDELTVGVVGNRAPEVIGIMRVLPRTATSGPFIYSLDVKRDWQCRVHYECPARLSSRDNDAVRQAALDCWKALGCRDVARFDFRLRAGVPYFLEANPLPGLSPLSGDLVILSRQVGIEYEELIARILEAATQRLGLVRESSLVG